MSHIINEWGEVINARAPIMCARARAQRSSQARVVLCGFVSARTAMRVGALPEVGTGCWFETRPLFCLITA